MSRRPSQLKFYITRILAVHIALINSTRQSGESAAWIASESARVGENPAGCLKFAENSMHHFPLSEADALLEACIAAFPESALALRSARSAGAARALSPSCPYPVTKGTAPKPIGRQINLGIFCIPFRPHYLHCLLLI